jgi:transposase-like protein
MSKIPQGEWDAIAARYAQGESITRIARSYGCTPPAIHYILKRSRQRTAPNIQQPRKAGPQASSIVTHRPLEPSGGQEILRPVAPPREALEMPRSAVPEYRSATVPPVELRPGRDRDAASGQPMPNSRPQPGIGQQAAGSPRAVGHSSAFTAGLDSELHGRAEAAMAAFRSSFDAALVEGSPHVRQKLRQAACDLMRVAARTTIVLDRLNASADRDGKRREEQSRSWYPRY